MDIRRSSVEHEMLLSKTVSHSHRRYLYNLLDIGISFVEGGRANDGFLDYASLDQLKEHIFEPLPRSGLPLEVLVDEIRTKIVDRSISQNHSGFLAFPDTGNSIAALGADILTPFLNQNLIAVDRSAPAATLVEIQLILWLRELIGYSTPKTDFEKFSLQDVGGIWTTGGNMSNHVAILAALHNRFPQVLASGLTSLSTKPAIVLAKGIEHFSFPAAARVLGIGDANIIWSAPSSDFTTDANSLRHAILHSDPGHEPFIVVSVAGNCRTTSLDSIREMRQVCDEFGLWLHVDACHGGSLLFSEKMRGQLDGIELADSISIDPHKGLFVTYPSSFALFRDPTSIRGFCRYPDRFTDPSCLDLGLLTPFFGSRGFHSLKLWAMIKNLGLTGIGECVDARHEVNLRMTEGLRKLGLFTFLNDNSFYRQAFVLLPSTLRTRLHENLSGVDVDLVHKKISHWTSEFVQVLYERGKVCLDHFSLADLDNRIGLGGSRRYDCCAMAIGHCSIEKSDEEKIWSEIHEIGSYHADRLMDDIGSSAGTSCLRYTRSPASW